MELGEKTGEEVVEQREVVCWLAELHWFLLPQLIFLLRVNVGKQRLGSTEDGSMTEHRSSVLVE